MCVCLCVPVVVFVCCFCECVSMLLFGACFVLFSYCCYLSVEEDYDNTKQ